MSEKPFCIVTGAGGFLGSHLAEFLMRSNFNVVGVDNFSTGQKKNFAYLETLRTESEFFPVEADVCQPWTWAKPSWTKNLKHIFHFASPASPPHYMRLWQETIWVNTWGLKLALDFANAHGATVLFSSTSEIYGDPQINPQPEDYRGNVNTVGPRSCYDEAKRLGETLVWSYNHAHKSQHKIVRIFNTYGPRMDPNDGRVIINFIKQALKGENLTVYGKGSQTRSFCFVDDLIRGIVLLAQSPHLGPMNLGSDVEMRIIDLATYVQKIFSEKNLNIEFLDLPQDDPTRRKPNLDLAQRTLGWTPKVSLEEGLKRMCEWLKNEA